MIRGIDNVRSWHDAKGFKSWKLFYPGRGEAKGDMVGSHHGDLPSVSWQTLGDLLAILSPGQYYLVCAMSFDSKEAHNQHKVMIDTRPEAPVAGQYPGQHPGQYPYHPQYQQPNPIEGIAQVIPGGLAGYIQSQIELGQAKMEIENLKRGGVAGGMTRSQEGWLSIARALVPHVPAAIAAINGGKAAPAPAQDRRYRRQAAAPKSPPASDKAVEVSQILAGINEEVEDIAATLKACKRLAAIDGGEALRKLAAMDDATLENLLPFLDSDNEDE